MRYPGQLALCTGSAGIVVLIFAVTGYRGAANWLAMLVPPIALAVALNGDAGRRAFMAMALIGWHFVLISVIGVVLIGY